MTESDVDQLVSEMMDKIHSLRSYLPLVKRQVQEGILRNICTQKPIFRTFEEPTIAHKRGFLLETVVKAHPSYEGTKMNSEERRIADAILEFIWSYSRLFPRWQQFGFKLPDDIIVTLKDSRNKRTRIAVVQQVIEVKHEGAANTARRQLPKKIDDLRIGIEILNRFVTPLQDEYGPSLGLRSLEESRWPEKVISVEIAENLEKILYLPDEAEIGEIDSWSRQNACFTKQELTTLIQTYWHKLVVVEKEEATTEEVGMAIRRAPVVEAKVRGSALDVQQEHEGEEHNDMTQEPGRPIICGRCGNEEPLSVEKRDGKLAYFYIDGQAVGRNCAEEYLNNRIRTWWGEVERAVAAGRSRLPSLKGGDFIEHATMVFTDIATNLMPIPRKFLLARFGYEEARSEVQLKVGQALCGPIKERAKGGDLEEAKRFETIVSDRLNRLRKPEGDESIFIPELDRDQQQGVTHNGDLLNQICDLFDKVHNASAGARALEALAAAGVPVKPVDKIAAAVSENAGQVVTPAAPETGVAEQVICPSCGEDNRAGRRLCNGCGEPLKQEKPPEVPKPQEPRVCPSCRTEAQPGDKICDNCGAQLPPEAEQQSEEVPSPAAIAAVEALDSPQPAASPEPAVDVSEKPKFCTECGEQNPSDAKYCKGCGHALPQ